MSMEENLPTGGLMRVRNGDSLMKRPSLNARDVEALAYIYSPQAQSPLAEVQGQRGAVRGSSLIVLTAGLRLLAALMMWRR